MKVFISWSGDASRQIAIELYDWLPMVVQSIEPYMSAETIEKGTRWTTSIASELEGTSVGIVVLTPDNLSSPWVNFEAGALAKVVNDTRLAPLLFGLRPSDVGSPLSQFQVTLFTKPDMLKLLKSINACAEGRPLPDVMLSNMHDALWSNLAAKIDPIITQIQLPKTNNPKQIKNETSEILEEILTLSRQQASTILNPEKLLTPELVRMIVQLSLEQNPSDEQRQVRLIVRSMFMKWRDLSSLVTEELASEKNDERRSRINEALSLYGRLFEELVLTVEKSSRRPMQRQSAAGDHERLFNTGRLRRTSAVAGDETTE